MKLLGDGKKNSAELGTEAKMKVKAGNLKLEGRRQQAHGVPMEGEGGGISATRCATLGGGLSLVQYEATGGFKSGALLHAAESGDIEQVKSLCRKYRNRATSDDDPIADEDVMFHAARSGNLELVKVSTCGRRAGSGGLTTEKKSGCGRTAARGAFGRPTLLPGKGAWRFCSGCEPTAVRGPTPRPR